MITFKEIQKKGLSDLSFLIENEKYYAHTCGKKKQTETLKEHLQLVDKYFLNIVETNKLESIIDNVINQIITSFKANQQLNSYLKTLFYNAIIYHDFGKINHFFQQKEGINNFNKNIKKRKHKESSNHSPISAYIFMMHHFKQSENLLLDNENQVVVDFLISCFSFPIYKHHSSYLSKIDSKFAYPENNIGQLKDFLTEFRFAIEDTEIDDLHNLVSDLETTFKQINELGFSIDFFPLFALLKLNYSLLTASDYYATSEYMNGDDFNTEEEFGLLTNDLKQKILKYFVNNKETSYNGKLINNPEQYLSVDIDDLKDKSLENLNFIRQKLGAEVLTNIEKHKEQRIFYIEAPTGGGKTNMSMIAIYKMLQLHSEINKIFYVFPFTTLITQTAKAIKETLGLTEQEVTQVHSKAGFQTKETDDNEQDAKYGNEKRNQIDNLFINYPLTLLTHIKFFNILKSNKKDTNYILHRLANSVVIIDELQAYSPAHWDKIKFYIAKYAEFFNIRFIIMSATLPKIDKIKIVFDTHFKPLIPEAKKYLQNNNFAKRVIVKSDLLEDKELDLSKLADILLEKSKNYAKNRTDKYTNSVYTIIEFIFKKSASQFYDIAVKNNKTDKFFDEIFVLSGTIIEPRRKYIIEYLKDEQNRKKKILLITTQVVEAGVDIDMDLGFKNQSLIDSDEQLAGRINRNIKKENCELWLFKKDNPAVIYGKDLRYKEALKFSNQEIADILTDKDFEKLYKNVFSEIDKLNKSGYKTNFDDYIGYFEKLNFRKINNEFKLIDSENTSVFVPADINIKAYDEDNFSKNELKFIDKNKCRENEKQVSGEKIWDLYVSFIQNKKKRFSTDLKILNGIMSKFVFSVYKKMANELHVYCEYDEKHSDFKYFQYLKLRKTAIEGEDIIFSFEGGLNEKVFKKDSFLRSQIF